MDSMDFPNKWRDVDLVGQTKPHVCQWIGFLFVSWANSKDTLALIYISRNRNREEKSGVSSLGLCIDMRILSIISAHGFCVLYVVLHAFSQGFIRVVCQLVGYVHLRKGCLGIYILDISSSALFWLSQLLSFMIWEKLCFQSFIPKFFKSFLSPNLLLRRIQSFRSTSRSFFLEVWTQFWLYWFISYIA